VPRTSDVRTRTMGKVTAAQRSETALAEFLRASRARVQPHEAGLVDDGHLRRVAGLRREEVAQLANISVDYLARLEQGRVTSVSVGVLRALADALRLSADAREYLVAIAGDADPTGSRPAMHWVRPQTQQLLDSMRHVSAVLLGRGLDVLAWNRVAAALLADFDAMPVAHRNLIWMTFLDPDYRALLHDWETVARNCVAYLRMDARRYPNDSRLAALIGELSVKDDHFLAWWGSHTVRAAGHRHKRYRHPIVGEITLDSQQLRMDDEPDQYVVAYTARPDTTDEKALRFLSACTASPKRIGRRRLRLAVLTTRTTGPAH
jgi:transcriptional regulator with XRE-family HTH domain